MNLARTRRLLQLLSLLQNPYGGNAVHLASACGVSKRTLFRDLQLLKAAGVPLQFNEQQDRYTLASTDNLPARDLLAEEALALLVLCHENARSKAVPLLEAAQNAATKLEASLPGRVRTFVQTRSRSIVFGPRPSGALPSPTVVFSQLVDAAAECRATRIQYASVAEGELLKTRLAPYCLVHCRHAWYVIGRSSWHRAVRTFHLARIEHLELLDETFVKPRGFNLKRYFGNAWSMIREPGPDRHVQIKFSPRVARNVQDVQWHPTQVCTWLPSGELLFTAQVSGLQEIAWWILGYADEAQVLEPAELRTLVCQRARRTAEQYER